MLKILDTLSFVMFAIAGALAISALFDKVLIEGLVAGMAFVAGALFKQTSDNLHTILEEKSDV